MNRYYVKVSAIIFDFYGTIFMPKVSPEYYIEYRVTHLKHKLISLGYNFSSERIKDAVINARKICNIIRKFSENEVNVYGEIALMLHILGVKNLNKKLVRDISKTYVRPFLELLVPDKNLKSVLSQIKREGIKIGMISNTMYGWANRFLLKKYDLDKYFDELVFSDEICKIKPSPKIFEYILKRLNVRASETIMVGDEDADIIGARLVGIKPVLIARSSKNVKDNVTTIRSLSELILLIRDL